MHISIVFGIVQNCAKDSKVPSVCCVISVILDVVLLFLVLGVVQIVISVVYYILPPDFLDLIIKCFPLGLIIHCFTQRKKESSRLNECIGCYRVIIICSV